MNCPHCPVTLESLALRGVQLDRCRRCEGIWFDRDELAKFNRFDSDFPLRPDSASPGVLTSLRCPRCDSFLTVFPYVSDGSLEVERCISCKGVWLDARQIQTIRKLLTRKLVQRRRSRQLDETARREQEKWEAHTAAVAEDEKQDSVSGAEWLFMFVTRLPVEVHNPVRRFPWATMTLIAINAAIFGVQQVIHCSLSQVRRTLHGGPTSADSQREWL
jgi:Zn-finger nucleic acid-binding protein